jgi:hypothetical protein
MPGLNLRLTEEQLLLFKARAADEGVPVTRMIVADAEAATWLAAHRQRVSEASARVGERSVELERRLA